MKKIYLVLSVMVVALTLFAARNVSAVGCDNNLPTGWCFENNGVKVEALADPSGNFPQVDFDNNKSMFMYRVTNTGKQVNFIDALIPFCTPLLGDPLSSPTGGTKYNYFTFGAGDPNTGFGLGLTNYRVFQWNYDGNGTISFTLNGKVFASPNALFLNRGTGNFAYGQIFSPACNQPPTSVFGAKKKEVKISGYKICYDTDASGCPQNITACVLDASNECTCGTDLTINPGTVLDLRITGDTGQPGSKTLKEAVTISDPTCPVTFLAIEGSNYVCTTFYGRTRCVCPTGLTCP